MTKWRLSSTKRMGNEGSNNNVNVKQKKEYPTPQPPKKIINNAQDESKEILAQMRTKKKNNAQNESKEILAQMRAKKAMKVSANNSNIIQELQQICSTQSQIHRSITFAATNKQSGIFVVSSDPYILCDLASYYQEVTGGDITKFSSVDPKRVFQIKLLFEQATQFSHFGLEWVPIIIDYMNQQHPNYKLISVSQRPSARNGALEKLYFVPMTNSNNNYDQVPKYDDVQLQNNEGDKAATFQ